MYTDYNSTYPFREEIHSRLSEVFKLWGNPSSATLDGRKSRDKMEQVRERFADLIQCRTSEIFFTSGATESNAIALSYALNHKDRYVLYCAVEHPSILYFVRWLSENGIECRKIPVDAFGVPDFEFMQNNISKASLLCMMYVNNETGNIHDIKTVSQLCLKHGVWFHCDSVQALGKLPVSCQEFDSASFSAHKIGALKGLGILYLKKSARFQTGLWKGSQEKGIRGGTENTAGIFSLDLALDFLWTKEECQKIAEFRDEWENFCIQSFGAQVNGDLKNRICNTTNLRFNSLSAESLLFSMDMKGHSLSMGSACSSGANQASHVLLAMGLSEKEAKSSLRFSFGRENTTEELQILKKDFTEIVQRMSRAVKKGGRFGL